MALSTSRTFRLLSAAVKRRDSLPICTFWHRNGLRMLSTETKLDISGIYPPITTPFDRDENIAWDKLGHNLQQWNQFPFRGYAVQGSNGEYPFLSTKERVEMVRRVKEMVPSDKLIIAGSGCESTRDTIVMTQEMADAGADAALVVTPCYYKSGMNNTALIAHYRKVADNSPIPLILYNVPSNTGTDLPAEVVIDLSTYPNIIGLKDSGGDISKIGHMVFRTKESGFQILAGSAGFLFPAYMVGCVGGVLALANVLGQECCDVEKLFKAKKYEEAAGLQHRLIAPNAAVTRKYGVPGLKVAMEWFGFYGGPTRSPLCPLPSESRDAIKLDFQYSKFL